jgi:hypothetical protein
VSRRIRYEDSEDLTALIRQHKHRAKSKSAADSALSPEDWKAIRRLLGNDIPEDIREKLLKQLIRHREEMRRRAVRYHKPRRPPLIVNVNCSNSFLLDVTTRQRACYCICKKAKHGTVLGPLRGLPRDK